jgi:hypothetical protein
LYVLYHSFLQWITFLRNSIKFNLRFMQSRVIFDQYETELAWSNTFKWRHPLNTKFHWNLRRSFGYITSGETDSISLQCFYVIHFVQCVRINTNMRASISHNLIPKYYTLYLMCHYLQLHVLTWPPSGNSTCILTKLVLFICVINIVQ